jgi:hypothetical protein
MKKLFSLLTLMMIGVPFCATAQTAVYAAFSASNLNASDVGWQYGGTVGIYYDPLHAPLVSAGLDLRGSFVGSSGIEAISGLIGPRVQIRPHIVPLQPYIEGLVGVAHVELGQGNDATKLQYEVVAGADWTILPRIDWRVVEFSYGGLSGFDGSFNPATVSTGLVLRLP